RPVPLRAMLVAFAVASVSNDRVAFTWPAAVGSNETEIAQLSPTASAELGRASCREAGSLLVGAASVAGAVPLLASVIASGPVVWPTWFAPKASVVGMRALARSRPVPLRAMLVVLAVASVSNDRVAFTWPAAVGSNETEIAQLSPTPSAAPRSEEREDGEERLARLSSEAGAQPILTSEIANRRPGLPT